MQAAAISGFEGKDEVCTARAILWQWPRGIAKRKPVPTARPARSVDWPGSLSSGL
jgi:hypothetical protein